MGRKNIKYNIGLDIGTNSVGWCVTDRENQILKFRGKRMWGVRLFEEGSTAAETRIKRGQRRRYMRRKERIRLLQELVGEMVTAIDNNFFIRLEDSFLWKEDKRLNNTYTLFADSNYTDKDYYKAFPTIYHLRKTLMYSEEKADPRHIYLALHHMIKYRGNFLYSGQNFKQSGVGLNETIDELICSLQSITDENIAEEINMDEIVGVLTQNYTTKKEKQENIVKVFTQKRMEKKLATELAKAMLGYSFDLGVVVNDKELVDENGKTFMIKFSDAKYEEQVENIEGILQERFEVIEKLHNIYSQYILSSILNGYHYLSEAMVAKYNKHHEDLKILKALVRQYAPNQYCNLFRRETNQADKYVKNYVNYIQGDKRCNQEELYKTIKDILKEANSADENIIYCMKEMEECQFLLRLNSRENSSIPWQMNKVELEMILDKQAKYYPVLDINKEKILSLLSFRIPYYVGPLNPKTSPNFAWVKRTEEKIYPWNFFEVINEDETAEKFITRMTNYCSYLPTEKVLPKSSLLYSRYCVLNELANIRVNERKLEPEDKKKIINDLFSHYKRITDKRFCDWLRKEQWGGYTEFKVTGYQKENEFASSLGSYIDFSKILGEVNSSNQEMIEQIIYWLTVFEEKTITRKKIKTSYPEIDEKQLKSILKLRYKGWGNLSQRLLTGLKIKQDEMAYSIMDQLENTKFNFKQIISNKELRYCKLIEQEQHDLYGSQIKIEDICALHGSPAIKRGIWQTVKIIQEIVKCMGQEPENIMIEFSRNDEESKRTISRRSKLLQAYERLSEEVEEYRTEVVKQLKDKKYADQLSNEKMFLYFIQNGKCMYTGVPLTLDELDKYEVDHIIPRCYIKDDSIENKVLVLKQENQRKLDNLLISTQVQEKNKAWWTKLYKHGLIGTKKYNNLTRTGLSENEQKGFINRQLVETRQICKHVAILLQESYVNSRVVTVKAELGHLFREKYRLYKNRNINDFHHAQDAYLSAIIGNTLLLNKECDSAEWIYNDYRKSFKKEVHNRKEKQGYVLSMFDRTIINADGEVVWQGQASLEEVLKVFKYKNCLVTKKLEEGTGAFYDETIYGTQSGKKDLIPLKEGLDVKKYGGYSGTKSAYSVAILYRNKKKIEKKLIGIPIQVAYYIKQGKYTLEEYLRKQGYTEVSILRDKVLKYQLIEENGELEYITSFQEICNAKQLILDQELQQYIYWININKLDQIKENSQKLDELYKRLMDKVKKYYGLFNGVWTQIEEQIPYNKLDIEDKCNLIQEILRLTKADAQNANLKKINKKLSDRAGRKQKTINLDGITFVDQSITGLFERRYTF